ncbi:MAG: 4-alpha-glucanotransferase [Verrucomicrobia bacterium]|nr:4-alpha-glucanotransferase [Verrucomicrobiota bacterium]
MSQKRCSGILLHPTSLPGRFGIGDLGPEAYRFVDFLERGRQRIWQVLPLGPTGYEHSPYTMNFSAFAGNPLLISLDELAKDNLLRPDEATPLPPNPVLPADKVDFARVVPHKHRLLRLAFERFRQSQASAHDGEYERFCREQSWWLEDFELFMALLEAYDYKPWNQWEPAVVRRDAAALAVKRKALSESIEFHRFLQFEFFRQWKRLRAYANGKGIRIVGDVSIYVCHNSADMWAQPQVFKLDPRTFEPAFVAGVPPDFFSATGQLWGNPVYDWEKLAQTGYAWWIARFKATLQYVDIVRIDHFRGFEAYWQVRAGEKTAMGGEWIKGPGAKFFEALRAAIGSLPVMAEDLGTITPEVEALRDQFAFPGMRVLQFAFGAGDFNLHLPHMFVPNTVVYPGTHDNDTAIGWWATANRDVHLHVAGYLGRRSPEDITEINWDLIRLALASVADTAIIPAQDVLGLDSRARMNDPAINDGQWRWRLASSDALTPELAERLRGLAQVCGR